MLHIHGIRLFNMVLYVPVIDIENLFFVEYSQTRNISPVGLLFRHTRVKQHAKNITACNKNTIRTMNKLKEKNTEYDVYHSMQILYIKYIFLK